MTQTSDNAHIIPQENALDYMTGGNATVTFVDIPGQVRYTYKLIASDDHRYLWIKLLTGKDNTKDYTEIYVFHVTPDGEPKLDYRRNNRMKEDSPAVLMFRKVFRNLLLRPEINMDWLEIWHVGRCSRCGRTLTVPESIAAGIGPECILKSNNFVI